MEESINSDVVEKLVAGARIKAEIEIENLKADIDDIRDESKAMGVLQMIKYNSAHNELLKYAMLYQVKKNKEYRKGGMTWQEFCDDFGEPRTTIEDKLRDIRPLVEKCSTDFVSFAKVPFNKVRYLGRSILTDSVKIDNNNLIIDGTKISLELENKEEIASAIDTLIEIHKQEKEDLKKSLEKQKSNTEKIIGEETKGLKVERDALVKEVERLKPYDIEEKDVKWSVEHLEKMERLCSKFDFAARHFVMDERLKEDIHLMAKASQLIGFMNRYTSDLKKMWDEDFRPYDAM